MGSVSDVNQGVTQVALGLPQGVTGRIFPRQPGEQRLQGAGPAQPLQIAHQGKGAIPIAAPTEGGVWIELEFHQHLAPITPESHEVGIALGVMAHRTQTGLEQVGISEHRGQDGEMGQGLHDRVERR